MAVRNLFGFEDHTKLFPVASKYINDEVAYLYSTFQLKLSLNDEFLTAPDHSILFSGLICNNSKRDIVCLGGNVFGEIIIWNVNDNTLNKVNAHKGAIFDMDYNDDGHLLCTVSDDRSLVCWSSNLDTMQLNSLCQMYGHRCRPWRVKISQNYIISSGEDSYICLWTVPSLVKPSSTLIKRLELSLGSIRYLKLENDLNLKFAADSGAQGVVKLVTENEESYEICNPNLFTFNWTAHFGKGVIACTDKGQIVHKQSSDEVNWTIIVEDENLRYSVMHSTLSNSNQPVVCVGGMKSNLVLIYMKNGEVKLSNYLSQISGRIFSIIFLNCDRILVSHLDGIVTLMALDEDSFSLKYVRSFIVRPSKHRWVSAAILIEDTFLVVGDGSGSVLMYHYQKCTELCFLGYLHGHHGVTTFSITQYNQFTSYGRDGCARFWKIENGELILLDKRQCGRGEVEWPARVIKVNESSLLCGFRANQFTIFDPNCDQFLASFQCGGGNRSWDIKMDSNNSKAKFLFIKNGKIIAADLVLWKVEILKPPMHSARINCATVLAGKSIGMVCVLTAGEDCSLILSLWNRDELCHVADRRRSAHISSITCLKSCDTCGLIVSAGCRGQINAWRVDNTMHIRPVSKLGKPSEKCENDCRIFDLVLIDCFCNPNKSLFIAYSCSDAKIRFARFSKDKMVFEILDDFSFATESVHCTMKLFRENSKISIASTTSSGFLNLWKLEESLNGLKLISNESNILLEKCAIPCFDVTVTNSCPLFVCGSESGKVLTAVLKDNCLQNLCSVVAHSSTVTDITFFGENSVLSVALDERVALLQISKDFELCLKRIIVVSIPDPSTVLLLNPKRFFVAGAGCGIVEIDEEKTC